MTFFLAQRTSLYTAVPSYTVSSSVDVRFTFQINEPWTLSRNCRPTRQATYQPGYSVDAKGYLVDVKGYNVDAKGYTVDVKGYNVDAKGYMVDVKGYRVDAKGYMVDVKGYTYQRRFWLRLHDPSSKCSGRYRQPQSACCNHGFTFDRFHS
eukprot:3340308-Pyramimonas_sp.AAC.5